jgi:hypothetical protein
VCLCFGTTAAAAKSTSNRNQTSLTKSQKKNKKHLTCYTYNFNLSCAAGVAYITAEKCRGDLEHTAPAWNVDPAGPRNQTDLSGWGNNDAKYTQALKKK